MLKIGQKVTRTPKTIESMGAGDKRAVGCVLSARPTSGIVVYIHPKGRFHVVEFKHGLRETFDGVE